MMTGDRQRDLYKESGEAVMFRQEGKENVNYFSHFKSQKSKKSLQPGKLVSCKLCHHAPAQVFFFFPFWKNHRPPQEWHQATANRYKKKHILRKFEREGVLCIFLCFYFVHIFPLSQQLNNQRFTLLKKDQFPLKVDQFPLKSGLISAKSGLISA